MQKPGVQPPPPAPTPYPLDAFIEEYGGGLLPYYLGPIAFHPKIRSYSLYLGFGIDTSKPGFKEKFSGTAFKLNLLPQPFGYLPPSAYGLPDNYLGELVPPLMWDNWIPTQSKYLRTHPTADPSVKAAEDKANILREADKGGSIGSVGLLSIAPKQPPDLTPAVKGVGGAIEGVVDFFDPRQNIGATTLAGSVGGPVYNPATAVGVTNPGGSLLAGVTVAKPVPGPLPIAPQLVTVIKSDPAPVIPQQPTKAPPSIDTPPAKIDQQIAARRANDLVKHLLSERADP